MIVAVVYALIGGVITALARVLNGRLAMSQGALKATLWNHVGGAIFGTLIVIFWTLPAIELANIPLWAYAGGAVGVFYIMINAAIVSRLGVLYSTLFVICGQLMTSLVIDIWQGKLNDFFSLTFFQTALGCVCIVIGILLSMRR